jgi:branched-chain amino acid transport system substrate-binding protein
VRVLLAVCLALGCSGARAEPALRIAFIDPLSGPFALTGEIALKRFRQEAEHAAGLRVEIVPLDNKGSAQESVTMLRRAVDQGIRYVAQGQGSGAAVALVEAIERHNERDPARAVLLLNYAALDPALTNERCSFWHFRFDAHVEMRMEALTSHLARAPDIRRVYLVVQDYSFGHQFAAAARAMLARKRPDIEIVGEDRHPPGQVRDFAPYIAKIRAARADAVLTGNWGNDMNLLVKAAREAKLDTRFYTFFASSPGAVAAMGEAALGRVRDVTDWHANLGRPATLRRASEFRQRTGEDFHFYRVGTLMRMLAAAVAEARSVEPRAVAFALEGARIQTDLGEVRMRARDHQLLAPLVVAGLARSAAAGGPRELRVEAEKSGLGWQTLERVPEYVAATPTSCEMRRPAR